MYKWLYGISIMNDLELGNAVGFKKLHIETEVFALLQENSPIKTVISNT